jgi:hypothetical protein
MDKASKPSGPIQGREIPSEDVGVAYLHCAQCIKERPSNISPKDWAMFSVAWTKLGIQVWCTRHERNVVHIDFEGCKHAANLS